MPNPEPLEEPDVAQSEISRIWWFGVVGIWFITKNCCTMREVWQGALSWCSIWLFPHFSGLLCWMVLLKCFRTLIQKAEFTVCPTGPRSWCTTPKFLKKKAISMIFCLNFVTCSFLFVSDMLACHWRTAVSSEDHRQRTQDLCPVIIFSRRSASCIDFSDFNSSHLSDLHPVLLLNA